MSKVLTVFDPFENSAQIKERLEKARQNVLAENYFVCVCRMLTLDGVTSLLIERRTKDNQNNKYFNAKNIYLDVESTIGRQCDYKVTLMFAENTSEKKKLAAYTKAKKFISAARGSLTGHYYMVSSNFSQIPVKNIVTLDNYQDFICNAMKDETRRVLWEQQSIQEILQTAQLDEVEKSAAPKLL